MRGALIGITGNWAHFRKPETSNNPLSHDFITKTALIGLIGAVLGIERTEMKALFPQLSDDLLYGVQVRNAVRKQSWGFTNRSVSDAFAKAPKQMELIRDPSYYVLLGLANERSASLFDQFITHIKAQEAHFTPILGLHNCPAELKFVRQGTIDFVADGPFETKGFIEKEQLKVSENFRIGFERIPSYQNDDFWNLPDKYKQVVYPSETETRQRSLSATGPHYIFTDQSQWVLI
ncbi:CRISPR-associated protein Cas5 [Larkinella bovis]|uniref:CRISPR-associated protein Cas5 n=1 Tax=Larkinella bovis TaxID=683041 RepID=A0ABW0I4G6_9BACT